MAKTTGYNWKKTSRILTNTVTVAIGLLIVGIIFFKFVPGFGFYIVKTGSMAPAINPGDVIFSAPAGDRVTPGEIITFEPDKKVLVTHRVIAVENGLIKTQGDANEDPDGTGISMSQVQGKYLFKIPAIGQITTILHTKMGWFMIVIVPSILLVLWIVVEIIKEVFKESGQKTTAAGQGNLIPSVLKPYAQQAVDGVKTTVSAEKQKTERRVPAQSNRQTDYQKRMTSRRLPSKEVVVSIRKDLKFLLKDIY
jgi:signal peptidase I